LAETLAVRLPFSIYLGWITVATVANVTSLLDYLDGMVSGSPPRSDVDRAAVVLVISALMNFTRRDIATPGNPLGLAGISVKHAAVPAVAIHLDHLQPGGAHPGSGVLPAATRAETGAGSVIQQTGRITLLGLAIILLLYRLVQ